MAYGLQPTQELIESDKQKELYLAFLNRIALRERVETVKAVSHKVQKGISGAEAVEPFIYYDSAFAVVSTASLHLAC